MTFFLIALLIIYNISGNNLYSGIVVTHWKQDSFSIIEWYNNGGLLSSSVRCTKREKFLCRLPGSYAYGQDQWNIGVVFKVGCLLVYRLPPWQNISMVITLLEPDRSSPWDCKMRIDSYWPHVQEERYWSLLLALIMIRRRWLKDYRIGLIPDSKSTYLVLSPHLQQPSKLDYFSHAFID